MVQSSFFLLNWEMRDEMESAIVSALITTVLNYSFFYKRGELSTHEWNQDTSVLIVEEDHHLFRLWP